jgi:predicted nucleic acid-binding Zn ribbon protein
MKESRADKDRFRRRCQALFEWRGLPEVPNPARNQHSTSALVPKLMARLGLAGRLRDEEIAAAWRSIAGEFAARFSHPQKLRHRTLVVLVSQPSVLWTLDRSKTTLLARLQEKFGPDTIRDLRFQAG